jgi:hypothetical protein
LHWQHLYFFFGKAEALPKENPFAYIPMFSRGNEKKLIWSAELVNEKWGAQPKNGGIFSKSQNTQENNFHVKIEISTIQGCTRAALTNLFG